MVLVSSGAIAAGLAPLGLPRRPRDLATQQAAASVGQGLLVHRYTEEFARHGIVVGQVLLTVDDVTRRSHYRNAYRTFAKLLELGVLPIVNENDTVATAEIRFGDNDRLAALVAHLVHADLLLLLSDVDGLYDGNPARGGATLLPDVVSEADLDAVQIGRTGAAGVGTGGMDTKVEAARIATGAGIPVVLTSAAARRARRSPASRSARCSTPPASGGRPGCCGWRTPPRPRAGSVLDDGAVRAVTERRASLLPAGITGVAARSSAGDPVDLVDPDGVAGRPRAGQLRRRRAARTCWAGPPASWPASWARRTSARSSTATTWCCCLRSGLTAVRHFR